MNRQEKIKLLQDIANGKSSIEELLPIKNRIWEQVGNDPDLFHCKEENLSKRKDEPLPSGTTGWRFFDIFVYKCGPPIRESE